MNARTISSLAVKTNGKKIANLAVRKNAKKIAEYIQNRLKEDQVADQMTFKEYEDPFTGRRLKSYNSSFRSAAPDLGERNAGGTSNTVLAPAIPWLAMR